ncbi:LysE/ArgO family amino acid transporter [Brevibacillus sp. NRS-1366]|uniref:LysE/ArgO family amino acid transporter n=1 Tax=Brevibacillus sp. NRS-1366 TaxID=3233899 RepID=UPI003D1C7581
MAVWDGLLFGMLLQLSVGPVCLAVLQQSITRGFRHAWRMIASVALVDAFYMAGAIGGLSLLLQLHWVKQLVLIGGAVILAWFGVGSLRSKVGEGRTESESPEHGKERGSSFLYGLSLTLSNPLTILFWSGVFGSLMASHSVQGGLQLFFFAGGCLLSTLFFLGLVAILGAYLSRFFVPKWLQRLNIVVGLFLIGFALILLQKGLSPVK